MNRRAFNQLLSLGTAGLLLPSLPAFAHSVDAAQLLEPGLDRSVKKRLADAALQAATAGGASYADVRIGRYLNQTILTRENKVQGISNTESFGVGVRVLINGCWGFAALNAARTEAEFVRIAQKAVSMAKANGALIDKPVQLVPQQGLGEVAWQTPTQVNSFTIPLQEKVELLLATNAMGLKSGASFANSQLFLINEQKYFASTDGSYIDQDIHRLWPTFTVTAIDAKSGQFETRDALSAPMGMGYEYLQQNPADKIRGITPRYHTGYDILEDVAMGAQQAQQMLTAKPVEAGKYDLVLDPSHTWLTIHESVGHPLELDRVLGYEANFAGTSFATLDKWKSGRFKYGSPLVTFFADKNRVGSLATVGYDDEGVPSKQWDLVKDGILVNYQGTRDQVGLLGQTASHGCSYASTWAEVQFGRMGNVSLAPGRQPLSVDQLIKDVKRGIYFIGNNSYSIDQQRYNFQFSGQLAYEIKDGQLGRMLKNAAYQSNSQEFWNSCVAVCDERDFRSGGSFFDGKGEPMQWNSVSHGSATARFNGVNVINTARKL